MTEELDTNILEFPKSKIVRDPLPDSDELKKMKKKSVKNLADSLTAEVCDTLLSHFDNYGIDTDNETFVKDFIFLSSIVAATIYRTLGVDHEFHDFIDAMVSVEDLVDKTE